LLAPALELLIVFVLVLINGMLAMSELAIVSARKTRLQQRAGAGDHGARAALALANEPNRLLATIQIGITLIGILAGAFGGATLARTVAGWLQDAGLRQGYSQTLGVGFVVLGITYLSLVIGELVPKRFALQHSETIAVRIARPMRILSLIAAPAVAVLSVSTEAVLRALGLRSVPDTPASEEEIKLIIQQSTEAGVFEVAEQELVTRVFHLADRQVAHLMTPRPAIVWLDIDDPPDQIWREMAGSHRSQFPVCQGNLDTVLGVLAARDVWAEMMLGNPVDLPALLQPPLFVPEHMPMLKVLELFKQSGTHLALAIDEFGGTQGLITLNDVLEAIVGDIPVGDESHDPRFVQREDGSWLVDGMLPVNELKALLQRQELPDEDEYQTLGGFIMLQLAHIPSPGEYFVWERMRFEVMDMDGNRIDKVLIVPLRAEQGANGAPPDFRAAS
jgi:putative hemolysin